MPQKMYAGMDVFVLLSIPGFILAGNLMNRGGITTRLIRLAGLLTRGVPGARFSPMASAPARTAASAPASSVTPQILTNGTRSEAAGSAGIRPAATNDAAVARGSGERMSASPTSAAS